MKRKLTDDQLDGITFGPGLRVTYSGNYTAYVDSDREESKLFAIRYQHEQMPPFKTLRFSTAEQLAEAMIQIAPLDHWQTIESEDGEDPATDEE